MLSYVNEGAWSQINMHGRPAFQPGMWTLPAKIGFLVIACLTVALCYLNTGIFLELRILAYIQLPPDFGTGSSSAPTVFLTLT